MSDPITIQVLAFGEIYKMTLNALAAFMGQSIFQNFLKLTALIGIIMVSVGYLKRRDPTIYAKWLVSYVLVLQLLITPKTNVAIYDIAEQKNLPVKNVPLIFAVTASILTNIGVGIAETYDALLAIPDDLKYTKTGSLFGSKLIQGARDFRILNPVLKQEMSEYFKNCVVGDIQINHKYSVGDLGQSTNIFAKITENPSPLRMTKLNGEPITCRESVKPLKAKLEIEMKKAYQIFGVQLFHHATSNYETLFQTQLASSFAHF